MKENGRWKANDQDRKRDGGRGIERQKGNSSRPEHRREWKRKVKGGERSEDEGREKRKNQYDAIDIVWTERGRGEEIMGGGKGKEGRREEGGGRVRGKKGSGNDENLVEGNGEDAGGEETQARCEYTR
jgi:hypothetical protein